MLSYAQMFVQHASYNNGHCKREPAELSRMLAVMHNCAAPDFVSAQKCAAVSLWKKKKKKCPKTLNKMITR